MLLQESRPRTFHPQFVENIAAEVFWGYAFRIGYHSALDDVLGRDFEKLWSPKKAAELARRFGGVLSKSDVSRLYDAVNEFMAGKAEREENILGTLYVEDFARCKPHRFAHAGLLRRLRDADGGGQGKVVFREPPSAVGDLLLRTPFPAALLIEEPPKPDAIYFVDTRKALDLEKIMLLRPRSFTPLPPNPQGYTHAAHGVFEIPCRDPVSVDGLWYKLMPNSRCCEVLSLC
jgi:hypothetical protein